jgi:hypothetical protein
MKRKFYLVALVLLLASVFTSPVFAHHKDGGGDPNPPTTTALPINSAVLYLAIAGLVIGLVAVYKFRMAKAAKV